MVIKFFKRQGDLRVLNNNNDFRVHALYQIVSRKPHQNW